MYRASAKQTASRHPTKNVKQAGGITMEHATPARSGSYILRKRGYAWTAAPCCNARPFDEQSLREDFEATGGQWRAEADG